MQMGKHVARIVEDEIEFGTWPTRRIRRSNWDKGTHGYDWPLEGRGAGGRFKFLVLFAWLTWLFVHLIFLVGFRNKIAVLMQWTYPTSLTNVRRGLLRICARIVGSKS